MCRPPPFALVVTSAARQTSGVPETRGTDSWLDDAHKNFAPDLPPIWIALCYCKFGQLILGKILKIIATRWHILRLICTKFDFGWGSAPDPAGGAFSAPQTL